MTTIKQLVSIADQYNEIVKRVGNGSLNPATVMQLLQDVIVTSYRSISLDCCGEIIVVDDSMLSQPWTPQPWFRGYTCQRSTAERKWPTARLPEPPTVFFPSTQTEHPLGFVPDDIDSLWYKVDAPPGYTKYRWEGVKSDKRNLRLAPIKVEFTEPVWLAFDPEHGKGEPPNTFWGQVDIAGPEIFSALIQFPEWSLAWRNGASAPNLTGYQLKYGGDWSRVPCLDRWDDDLQMGLSDDWAGIRNGRWSSPSVREC